MPNEDYGDDDDGRNLLYLFADLFIEDYKSFKYVCNLWRKEIIKWNETSWKRLRGMREKKGLFTLVRNYRRDMWCECLLRLEWNRYT